MNKFKKASPKRISELDATRIEAAVSQAALCQSQINQATAGLQTARAKVKAVCDANGIDWAKVESGELYFSTDGHVMTRQQVKAFQSQNGQPKEGEQL